MSCIDEIQKMLNKFLWQGKRPRVKMSLLFQKSMNGGIFFYLASRLVAIKTWWQVEDQSIWEVEKYGILVPLKEWALSDSKLRATGF